MQISIQFDEKRNQNSNFTTLRSKHVVTCLKKWLWYIYGPHVKRTLSVKMIFFGFFGLAPPKYDYWGDKTHPLGNFGLFSLPESFFRGNYPRTMMHSGENWPDFSMVPEFYLKFRLFWKAEFCLDSLKIPKIRLFDNFCIFREFRLFALFLWKFEFLTRFVWSAQRV